VQQQAAMNPLYDSEGNATAVSAPFVADNIGGKGLNFAAIHAPPCLPSHFRFVLCKGLTCVLTQVLFYIF
jgi:hypothetical protein